ncbi:hypothetical protein [Nocardioides flavescens]|uniref:Uncharacterized protein n=1 Tax=Nocardioides flavescens TaxID=2691959 RepID=A0A6L7EY09_9ACTN|nr:hypothetical protein [Nocardioides flavescens]MXG88312.1 hypothetical protein [Nocardioides flavescens]
MSAQPPDDWSPADHPEAIAVSEGQWWQWAAQLAIARLAGEDDCRFIPVSTRQIDARHLVLALAQLLRAEALQQAALKELEVDPDVRLRLRDARERYLHDLPGLEHMRNALIHFDEWSGGRGHGPQKVRRDAGDDPREVARDDWGFRFDPATGTITHGAHQLHTSIALRAANELAAAIYDAARSADATTSRPAARRTG